MPITFFREELTINNFKDFEQKIEQTLQAEELDLSVEEDLSIAVMNLISIEEHLFFSGGKTDEAGYYNLLKSVREIRRELLEDLLDQYEAEEWCVAKHLLGATMRLMETATKHQADSRPGKAEEYFKRAYDVYSLFWGVKLGQFKSEGEEPETNPEKPAAREPGEEDKVTSRLNNLVNNIVDCCK